MPRGVGWFATHKWPQAKRKAVDEPEPETPIDDGKIPCPSCEGEGTDDTGAECERCDGTGRIDNPNEANGAKEKKAVFKALDGLNVAIAMCRRRTGLSLAAATLQVLSEQPDLYQDYLDEREDATITSARKKAYLAGIQQRFAVRGIGTIEHVRTSNLPMR